MEYYEFTKNVVYEYETSYAVYKFEKRVQCFIAYVSSFGARDQTMFDQVKAWSVEQYCHALRIFTDDRFKLQNSTHITQSKESIQAHLVLWA